MYGTELLTKDKADGLKNLRIIENELVPVYETSTGEKVVYGTELHAVLGVRTSYRDWSERRLNDIDALENEDYEAAQICAPSGQSRKEHIIKLDTAKEMAMLERNEKGKQVRRYFIRVEKKYKGQIVAMSELSPDLQLFQKIFNSVAQQQLEQKRQAAEIERVKSTVNDVKAKLTTRNEDYFTVAGYASLRGLKVDVNRAGMLGRKATKLSKEYGYEVSKVKDPRFGTVNSYHVDILKEIFK